jgi:hypothetical protein
MGAYQVAFRDEAGIIDADSSADFRARDNAWLSTTTV